MFSVNGLLPKSRSHAAHPCGLGPWRFGRLEPGHDGQYLGIDPVEVLQQDLLLPSSEIVKNGQFPIGSFLGFDRLQVKVDAAIDGRGLKFACIGIHGIRSQYTDHLSRLERGDLSRRDQGFEPFVDRQGSLGSVDGYALTELLDLTEEPFEPFQCLLIPYRSAEDIAHYGSDGGSGFLAVLLLEHGEFLHPEDGTHAITSRLRDDVLDPVQVQGG